MSLQNIWRITDHRVVELLQKNGFSVIPESCDGDSRNLYDWYETNCPVTFLEPFTLSSGEQISGLNLEHKLELVS